MNTAQAQLVATRVARLIELATIFETQYGRHYPMKAGSPAATWELHQAIFDQQVAIARLLDASTLEQPLVRWGPWWKWQDTLDSAMAIQMGQETFQLIARCACFEAAPQGAMSHGVFFSQSIIAGLLHPSALLVALDEREAVRST